MNKKYIIFGSIFIVFLGIASYVQRDLYTRPDPNIVFIQVSSAKGKMIFQDGKLTTTTVLSEEDAKRPCEECHEY